MLTQSQLKTIFLKYNFAPLKRLGENYLIDANVKDKIVAQAGVGKDDIVLEIGPGFGALTIDLAATGARVFAVEKDKKAYSIFSDMVRDEFPNIKLFNEDILDFDIKQKIAPAKHMKVIGNLPYYVTTPIIEYLIENRMFMESALIVVQKEVANRFIASAGTQGYGSISCFVQYYMKVSYIHTIKSSAFYPEPEVDSSLVRFDILDEPSVKVADEGLLFKIIRGAFNQRRKTIMNSLSREAVLDISKEDLAKILDKVGIDPLSRPEDLSLSAFANLTNAI
ncbi:MAG: 16S rRNA (adenine(1518)-N(6)/adenine(1519)-N(6))-dimethyltransferase RsmA [Candidatus Omnitrophota bacterium]|nr:16S rRNA (adenine(1518)-N(6)/adenine(1519)-N(6))-dimethyltransferase RsmA [Candidatus Omnitrophota bacterium]